MPRYRLKNLRRALHAGLLAIALMAVGGHLFIRDFLSRSTEDFTLINVAGKQRMLSQKIAKSSAQALLESGARRARALGELREALVQWERASARLVQWEAEAHEAPLSISSKRSDMEHIQGRISAQAERLVAALTPPVRVAEASSASSELQRQTDLYLPQMDRMVTLYELNAQARIQRLELMIFCLPLMLLLLLLFEAVFVIKPALIRMGQELKRRRTAETSLEAQKENLHNALEKARQADKVKSRFLATMSHEMRTPLNGVIGSLSLMKDTPLNGEQRDLLSTASTSGSALLSLINDILDLSKIEAGKLELENVDFKTCEVFEQSAKIVAQKAEQKGLKLAVEMDPTIPERLCGDPTRLRQVVLNLLSNAVKFTASGGVYLRVKSRGARGPDRLGLRIEVQDTGTGIPEKARERLFQPFVQANSSTTRKFGGTGLGLTIVHHIVTRMGGSIDFITEVGSGTLFQIELELGNVSDATIALPPKKAAVSTRSLHVLVTDDQPINRKIAASMLKRLGHTATLAHSGFIALAKLKTERFDLVLMDMQMPQIDGLETTRKIRQSKQAFSKVPIFALTANAMLGDKHRCLEAGMDDYLSKPLNLETLKEALHKVERSLEDIDEPQGAASNA